MSRLDKNHGRGRSGRFHGRTEERFDIPGTVIRCDLCFTEQRLVGRVIDVSLRGLAIYVLGQVPRDELEQLQLYLDEGCFSCYARLIRQDQPFVHDGWVLGVRCYRRLPRALFQQAEVELSTVLQLLRGGRAS